MNEEENNFKIDVDAEQQNFSRELDQDNFEPSQLYYVVKDLPLPEMVFYSTSNTFQNTNVNPQLANQKLSFDVKIDAETAYAKAEETEKQLRMMAMGIQELSEGIQPGWLSVSNKDNFEERVVVDPTNLIFENRREKMSMPPEWF